MSIHLNNIYANTLAAYQFTKRAAVATVEKLKVARLDQNGVQKSGLFALAIVQGVGCYLGSPFYPELAKSLDIANSFDIYGFLKIPYYWLHPYNQERIDPVPTLDALERYLCQQLRLGTNDPVIRGFAQESLQSFFDVITDNDWAPMKSEEEFNLGLFKTMVDIIRKKKLPLDPAEIDLTGFHPVKKPFNSIKALADFSSMTVDVMCGAFFLGDWQLLDLQYYADKLGRYRAFEWVPNQILDDWIRLGLCFSFTMQAVNAITTLCDSNASGVAKSKSCWQLAVAVSEFVFNFSVLQRCNPGSVCFFTAVAKGIGVLSVMFEPAPDYFPAGK